MDANTVGCFTPYESRNTMKKQTGNGFQEAGFRFQEAGVPRRSVLAKAGVGCRVSGVPKPRRRNTVHCSLFTLLLLLAAGLIAGPAQAWQPTLLATGGVTTIYTNNFVIYGCHSFTTVGSTNFTPLVANLSVQYLVIGGGGGGATYNTPPWYGGGGGAGGYRCSVPTESSGSNTTAETATNLIDTTPVPIVVGAGGGAGTGSGVSGTPATNGQDSSFGSIVATGGGRGGSYSWGPGTGGSGGGGQGTSTAGAGGTIGQGREGGPGYSSGSGGSGGGGGASAPGTGYNANTALRSKGGDGLYSSITGVSTPRGGGGGGKAQNGQEGGGGIGGGGNAGEKGTDGTGGGGGGNWSGASGKGGAGVVIVRYVIPNPVPAAGNLGVSDVTTSSATFNGVLVSTGSYASAVCVLWGLTNQGANWAWANTNWFNGGAVNPDWTNNTPFSTNISGLSQGTYYYTFGATNAGGASAINTPTNFITGEVTVKATVTPDQWKETGGSVTGKFTIVRPATCTNESLTVAYTLSGSVTNDTRYALLPSASATMAAGVTSTVVALTPYFFMGSSRQAILTLTAGTSNYPYGSPVANSATVTVSAAIVTSAPPFRAWGGDKKYVITNASGRIYAVHEYTNAAGPYFGTNYFVPSQPVGKIEYLVIGGGGQGTSIAGAGGTVRQGMAGGSGYTGPTKEGSGGGGGASAPGNGSNAGDALRSKGGDGLYSSITGVSTPRGGGGAGQARDNVGGGGGVGGGGSPTGNMNGQANTGGGGGGAWNAGGNGGSGVVIVRYDISPPKGTVIMMR